MRRITRAAVVAATTLTVLALSACDGDGSSESQKKENEAKVAGYNQMVKSQPAGTMTYSPTRETINKWIQTWDEPGKLAFVYIQNGAGEYGYFVTVGPPVSYCAMLTPNYELRGTPQSTGGMAVLPAPGMDGVYYSGGQCNAYYAMDATTGAYLEFTVGANQSFFLYDEPMQLPEFSAAKQLGPTSIEDVE